MTRLRKTRLRQIWLAVALATVIVLALLIILPPRTSKKAIAPIGRAATQKTTLSIPVSFRGLPVRLKIPAINVDSPMEYVGILPNGNMDVPSGSNVVGWYKYGAIPGEAGSAVIAGHVIGFNNETGVFLNLDKLRAGDRLEVTDAKGKVASFTVRQTKIYGQSEQPAEVFNSANGIHLNLITCAGEWDAATKRYLSRLVVFSDQTP